MLYSAKSHAERIELYRKKWDNAKWRLFARLFLSRFLMTLLFDKAFFAQLDESFSFGDHFRERVKAALTDLPLKDNYFLSYILLGRFVDLNHLPVYLRRENYTAIRDRIDRIEIVTGSCEDYLSSLPSSSISKFNFSNVFEWMTNETFESLLRETVRVARNGSIITYRNLLVPRRRPESLAHTIIPQPELSEHLHKRDLSFIYIAYVVEQIQKEEQ